MTTTITEYSQTEAALETLRQEYGNPDQFDVRTTTGMKGAKSARQRIRSYRTELEKLRKDIKAPALKRCKDIDEEAKRITLELRALEDPLDERIKHEEGRAERERQAAIEAEEKRVRDIRTRIESMRGRVAECSRLGVTAKQVEDVIDLIEATEIDDSFAEFRAAAEDAKSAALSGLNQVLNAVIEREENEAELKRLREDRERSERIMAELAELEGAGNHALANFRQISEAAMRDRIEELRADSLDTERWGDHAEAARVKAANSIIQIERAIEDRAAWEAEQAELAALRKAQAAEAEREAQAAADAEEAERKARAEEFPGVGFIVAALVSYFRVSPEVARGWLDEIPR